MFRQAFLLRQYFIPLFVNNILSVQTHNIHNIFLIADIVFILVVKNNSKKVCEKNGKQLNVGKSLTSVCNRNAELLRLVGATFDFKVASLRRMRKKNLIILKSLQKQSLPFFVLFVLSLFTFELSNINWKCSHNCDMPTERTYDSAVFKIFLNITITCIFIEQ